jgi:hypothetical protein
MTSKGILTPFLAAAPAFFLMEQPLSAATFGKFDYEVNGSTIGITDYPKDAVGAVVIPAMIVGKPVTSIEDNAFDHCNGLTSISIPNSVTFIGDGAFLGCESLTSFSIPPNVTEIGIGTFSGCSGLTSLFIPKNINSISFASFVNCSSLATITVDARNSEFSSLDGVLYDKNKTRLVQYPAAKAGSYALPDTVTSSGLFAFLKCSGLTSITVDARNSELSSLDGVLFNKNQTELIKYPDNKKGSYRVPNTVTSIGNLAFDYCAGLTSISIPAGVSSMSEGPFVGCTSLLEITVNPQNKDYTTLNGVLFNKSKTELVQYPGGKSGSYIIPGSVNRIGSNAFSDCSRLTSISIPDSVDSFGFTVFRNCTGLTSVSIPGSVTSIPSGAFSGCSALTAIAVNERNPDYSSAKGVLFNKRKTEIVQYPGGKAGSYIVPNSVTSIGESAFNFCDGITSLSVPDNVTSIGSSAFRMCPGLTSAYFYGNAPTVPFLSSLPIFGRAAKGFTVYHLKGKTGFTSPRWNGYPCLAITQGPEIDVQHPAGSSLADGSSKKSFGTIRVGATGAAKTFVIKNTGTSVLNGLAISIEGAHGGDFTVTGSVKTSLPSGGTSKFKVSFKPTAKGTRNASILIKSNDANENPFDIQLTGLGAAP